MANQKSIQPFVAARCLEARKGAGINQQTMGELLDTTQSAISLYENGNRGISLDTLLGWARLTNRPLSFFLGEAVGSFDFADDTPVAEMLAEMAANPELVERLVAYWRFLKFDAAVPNA